MAALSSLILTLIFISILSVSFFNIRYGLKIGVLLMGLAAISAIFLIINHWNVGIYSYTLPWFKTGELQWNLEFIIDSAAILMIGLVTFIGFLVYWFSIDYLKKEAGQKRYFILLLLFMVSMYGLVTSAHLFQLFFFWELVSFCSYGLIGFYYKKEASGKAATKAFLVNRVADLFIVAGLGLIYHQYETLSLLAIAGEGKATFLAGIFLLIGASGKSAQYPFAIWLPDAMAGPTPVSAFIHAATMVTAGIILLLRVYFMMPEEVLTIMAFLGALTAATAAIAALVQHDIKRMLAFSTISQLGYMVTGLGSGAWDASLFHLFTHAFFKAGLFLCAGAIILFLKKVQKEQQIAFDPQDIRFMGGIKKYQPIAFYSFTLCALALIGVPFFTGFLSKDAIITAAYGWAAGKGPFIYYLVPDLAFFTVVLTAIYMVRVWSLVFLGEPRLLRQFPDKKIATVLNLWSVNFSAIILGLLSLAFFISLNPFDMENNWVMHGIKGHLGFIPKDGFDLARAPDHLMVSVVSVALVIIGAAYAWFKYQPGKNYHNSYVTHQFEKKHLLFAHHHFYLDWFYKKGAVVFLNFGRAGLYLEKNVWDKIIHQFAIFNVVFAHILKIVDRYAIDGIVNFSALFASYLGKKVRSFASGKIQGQLVITIFFFIIILLILMF